VKIVTIASQAKTSMCMIRRLPTLPTSINPGIIAILYYKRWTIEKAYNNSKSNLKEKKPGLHR
ncbi:MAG: hypothetical protein NTX38_09920, partial [Methylobacter sp.]|nr:hypothetical protein [Methylobacter sp.]